MTWSLHSFSCWTFCTRQKYLELKTPINLFLSNFLNHLVFSTPKVHQNSLDLFSMAFHRACNWIFRLCLCTFYRYSKLLSAVETQCCSHISRRMCWLQKYSVLIKGKQIRCQMKTTKIPNDGRRSEFCQIFKAVIRNPIFNSSLKWTFAFNFCSLELNLILPLFAGAMDVQWWMDSCFLQANCSIPTVREESAGQQLDCYFAQIKWSFLVWFHWGLSNSWGGSGTF